MFQTKFFYNIKILTLICNIIEKDFFFYYYNSIFPIQFDSYSISLFYSI